MESNETKVTSFRVSQEVKEHIQRLMEQRQISTNQLFEQLISLADKQSPDPLVVKENESLEAALNQVLALFNERASRLETQQKEHERINARYKNTIHDLEQSVIAEAERLQEEYERKVSSHEIALTQLQDQINMSARRSSFSSSICWIRRLSFSSSLSSSSGFVRPRRSTSASAPPVSYFLIQP